MTPAAAGAASPWAFHPHPASWAAVGGAAAAYLLAVRRPAWVATRRQASWFVGGLLVLTACLTWPLADLAARWSLLALVVQRLLLVLAVPALLALGLPLAAVATMTRPRFVDAPLRAATRPPAAVVLVTAAAVGTMSTGAVDAQSTSVWWRALFDAVALGSGLVLWEPVIGWLPAARRPGLAGRAAYLMVQSIVPAFLSLVWIFARHPLYRAFEHPGRPLGMSPLLDQQLAGFAAKLVTIATLWSVAFWLLTRARGGDGGGGDDRLTWADVERELQRSSRRRPGGHAPTMGWPAPPGTPSTAASRWVWAKRRGARPRITVPRRRRFGYSITTIATRPAGCPAGMATSAEVKCPAKAARHTRRTFGPGRERATRYILGAWARSESTSTSRTPSRWPAWWTARLAPGSAT
ncbi:MAG TPA: cytochrome c oxidase assembly protein [Acidimicrobiales bacterium]|nr:cytochrome c oxidase assembly protein [Acidimicrobiales bacterium]